MCVLIERTFVALEWENQACVGQLLGSCQTSRNSGVALLLFWHREEFSKVVNDRY